MIARIGGPAVAPPPPPSRSSAPQKSVRISAPPPPQKGRGTPVLRGPVASPARGSARAVASGGGPASHSVGRAVAAGGSAASGAATRLANAIASQNLIARQTLLRSQFALGDAWGNPDQAFQSALAPVIPNGDPQFRNDTPRALQNLEIQGQVSQDFSTLKAMGLLPPKATLPPVEFPGSAPPGVWAYESGGRTYFPPDVTAAATNLEDPRHAAAQTALIHEMTHSLQSPETMSSIPNREGGATAYAQAVTPQALGPLPVNPGSYRAYLQHVLRQLGTGWVMHGQFRH